MKESDARHTTTIFGQHHAMNCLRIACLVAVTGGLIAGCRHVEPLVTASTDRTGWIQVGRVPAVGVTRMQRVMIDAGIPAWFDARGYPYYPVTVPPEHGERASKMLRERGYPVSR